jgi:hypothetical protein
MVFWQIITTWRQILFLPSGDNLANYQRYKGFIQRIFVKKNTKVIRFQGKKNSEIVIF